MLSPPGTGGLGERMLDAMPAGFLGTRADVFMDVVICIVAAVPLLLGIAFALARTRAYKAHRALQLTLSAVFVLVLVAFEGYIRVRGGIDGISAGSAYDQTLSLYGFLAIHLCFAVSSTLLWGWTVFRAIRGFGGNPAPGAHSAHHRRWGRIALVDMLLTALTGLGVYALCFVA